MSTEAGTGHLHLFPKSVTPPRRPLADSWMRLPVVSARDAADDDLILTVHAQGDLGTRRTAAIPVARSWPAPGLARRRRPPGCGADRDSRRPRSCRASCGRRCGRQAGRSARDAGRRGQDGRAPSKGEPHVRHAGLVLAEDSTAQRSWWARWREPACPRVGVSKTAS